MNHARIILTLVLGLSNLAYGQNRDHPRERDRAPGRHVSCDVNPYGDIFIHGPILMTRGPYHTSVLIDEILWSLCGIRGNLPISSIQGVVRSYYGARMSIFSPYGRGRESRPVIVNPQQQSFFVFDQLRRLGPHLSLEVDGDISLTELVILGDYDRRRPGDHYPPRRPHDDGREECYGDPSGNRVCPGYPPQRY